MKIIVYIASELQYYLHMLIGTKLRGKRRLKMTASMVVREVCDIDRAKKVASIVQGEFKEIIKINFQENDGRVQIFAEARRITCQLRDKIQLFAWGVDKTIDILE